MEEETKCPDRQVVQLTADEYEGLARLLQWPEDLPRWDSISKPTRLTEIVIG